MARDSRVSSSGSRAFHQKSRHGCKRCKERRVKCNMQRPVCNHCNRRNERCSYNSEEVGYTSYTIPVQHALPIVQFYVDAEPQGPVYRIPLARPVLLFALLGEVMNEVRPATVHEVELWRNTLERNSLPDNKFLWHSLSALHLLHQGRGKAHQGVKRKAIEIAYQHHIEASSLFGSMTPEVTEHSWPVYLGFAISIIICQFAMQAICPAPVFDYIEMIQVLRASRDIMYTMSGYLRASEMWPLIAERTKLTESDKLQDYGLQDALTTLDVEVEKTISMPGHEDYMHVAMKQLKEWVEMCEARPRRWGHYCSWPAVLPEGFMHALRSGDHLALILLLHWLAIIRLAPPRWFLEGWLIRTAEHILSQLPHHWDHLTTWPASIIRTDRNGLLYVGHVGGPRGYDLAGDTHEPCFQSCITDPAFVGHRHD